MTTVGLEELVPERGEGVRAVERDRAEEQRLGHGDTLVSVAFIHSDRVGRPS